MHAVRSSFAFASAVRRVRAAALVALACSGVLASAAFAQPAPGAVVVQGTPTREGNTGTTPMRFVIAMLPGPGAPISMTLTYRTEDGTATAGSDYSATQGTVTLTAQQPVAQINVPILGDSVAEPSESVRLVVEGSAPAIAASGLGYILDDDGAPPPPPPVIPPVVLALDGIVREPASGQVDGTLTLLRIGPNSTPLRIGFVVTPDSSASAGSDYLGPAAGDIDFLPGERMKRIAWQVLADSTPESVETVRVRISGPAGVLLPRTTATLRIVDTLPPLPPPPALVGIIACRPLVHEDDGSARFIVRRYGDVAAALSVDYASEDGTAIAGEDYTATTGSLAWAAGASDPRAVEVPILPDDAIERPERFAVRLANAPAGTVLAPGRAIAIILDSRDSVFTDDFAELCEDPTAD